MRHENKQIQSANQMARCPVCGQMCPVCGQTCASDFFILVDLYVVRCLRLILGFAAIYVESTIAVILTDNQRIHNTDTCRYSLHSL